MEVTTCDRKAVYLRTQLLSSSVKQGTEILLDMDGTPTAYANRTPTILYAPFLQWTCFRLSEKLARTSKVARLA